MLLCRHRGVPLFSHWIYARDSNCQIKKQIANASSQRNGSALRQRCELFLFIIVALLSYVAICPWLAADRPSVRVETRLHRATARGSHLYVACRIVCDRDQVFWSTKSVLDRLIAWSFPSDAVDRLIVPFWCCWSLDRSLLMLLIAWFPRVKGQIAAVRSWLLILRSPWALDWPPKRALITWLNFDPGSKRSPLYIMTSLVTTPHPGLTSCSAQIRLGNRSGLRD